MTNQEIFQIALEQSAKELNCSQEAFLAGDNLITTPGSMEGARKYYKDSFVCHLVSYGSNIVATVREDLQESVSAYIHKYAIEHCFETPNLYVLNSVLEQKGLRICLMAEYFLPDIDRLEQLPCDYEMKLLGAEDFKELYVSQWSNALCKERKELDVLVVGAYDNGRLIGLATCSADCEDMWQIGIDVLPEYRRKNIAAALTSRLAIQILNRGKVPFYCAAWSNVKSVRNAVKCGFKPAWVEITAKPIAEVEEMNQ